MKCPCGKEFGFLADYLEHIDNEHLKEDKKWNVKYAVYQYNGMKRWTYHKIHYVQIVGKTVIAQG